VYLRSSDQTQYSQPGQTSSAEVKKRDLRAELLAAEAEAKNKKRKAEGKPPLEEDAPRQMIEAGPAAEDDEANKRRKLLQEALEMDKDDDDEEQKEKIDGSEHGGDKDGDERFVAAALVPHGN
jgi:protein CWC15